MRVVVTAIRGRFLRAFLLSAAALLLAACFGHLSLGVNVGIDPHLVLPGSVATLSLDVEGDGLLGNAIRQQLTSSAFASAAPSGAKWEFRDNSDSQTVRIRAFTSQEFTDTLKAQIPGSNMTVVDISSSDYLFLRTYSVTLSIPPNQTGTATAPSGSSNVSQQAAAAALAGIRYDWSAMLPGTVGQTNGLRSDDGRVVWHVDLASTQSRILSAESTYIDLPRAGVAAGLAVVVGFLLWRSRRSLAQPAGEDESAVDGNTLA